MLKVPLTFGPIIPFGFKQLTWLIRIYDAGSKRRYESRLRFKVLVETKFLLFITLLYGWWKKSLRLHNSIECFCRMRNLERLFKIYGIHYVLSTKAASTFFFSKI